MPFARILELFALLWATIALYTSSVTAVNRHQRVADLNNDGVAHLRASRSPEAVNSFRAALRLAPLSLTLTKNLAWAMRVDTGPESPELPTLRGRVQALIIASILRSLDGTTVDTASTPVAGRMLDGARWEPSSGAFVASWTSDGAAMFPDLGAAAAAQDQKRPLVIFVKYTPTDRRTATTVSIEEKLGLGGRSTREIRLQTKNGGDDGGGWYPLASALEDGRLGAALCGFPTRGWNTTEALQAILTHAGGTAASEQVGQAAVVAAAARAAAATRTGTGSAGMDLTRRRHVELTKKSVLGYLDPSLRDGQCRRTWSLHYNNIKSLRNWNQTAPTVLTASHAGTLNMLQLGVLDVLARGIPGDFIELGVFRGGGSIVLKTVMDAYAHLDTHLNGHTEDVPPQQPNPQPNPQQSPQQRQRQPQTGRSGQQGCQKGHLRPRRQRHLWLVDTFEGVPPPRDQSRRTVPDDPTHTWPPWTYAATRSAVRDNLARFGVLGEGEGEDGEEDTVHLVRGRFDEVLPRLLQNDTGEGSCRGGETEGGRESGDEEEGVMPESDWFPRKGVRYTVLAPPARFAFIRIDADTYEGTMDALRHTYPRLSPGGRIRAQPHCRHHACVCYVVTSDVHLGLENSVPVRLTIQYKNTFAHDHSRVPSSHLPFSPAGIVVIDDFHLAGAWKAVRDFRAELSLRVQRGTKEEGVGGWGGDDTYMHRKAGPILPVNVDRVHGCRHDAAWLKSLAVDLVANRVLGNFCLIPPQAVYWYA